MVEQPAAATVDGNRLIGGVVPWAVATVVIVVGGALAIIVRPLAPELGAVPDPAQFFPAALLNRVAEYRTPVRAANLAGVGIDLVIPCLIALTPTGNRLVTRIVARIGRHRPVVVATAVTVVVVVLTAIARLPLAVWGYTHARSFGLSTQSLAGWAGDWAIALAIMVVSAAVLAGGGYALLTRWPRRWLLVVAPAALIMVATATLLAPAVIEPLQFTVVELPDGPVRQTLEPVLHAADRPAVPLLVADASRRTSRQNAYVSGIFGTRRIVLYDTLLERPPAEIALIVAHELAHERNRDLLRGVLAGAAGLWLLCVVIDVALRRRVRRGLQSHVADPRGAAIVVAVVIVAMVVTTPVSSWASRRAEAAADAGALRLSGATAEYCAVQQGLVDRNLSDPAPPTWERLWWWTHPPAASRLELAARFGDRCDNAPAALVEPSSAVASRASQRGGARPPG